MNDVSYGLDEKGYPVLVDDLYFTVKGGGHPLVQEGKAPLSPGKGVADQNTRSGNPFHDVQTGRFGFSPGGARVIAGRELLKLLDFQSLSNAVRSSGANAISAQLDGDKIKIDFFRNGAPVGTVQVDHPANTGEKTQTKQAQPTQAATPTGTPEEIDRRQDAVRAAGREIEGEITPATAEAFLKNFIKRELSSEELNQFVKEALSSRLSDLVDSVDTLLTKRRKESIKKVRIEAPANWVKRTIGGLSDSEISSVVQRLIARGYSEEELSKWFVVPRVDENHRDTILEAPKKSQPQKRKVDETRSGSPAKQRASQ